VPIRLAPPRRGHVRVTRSVPCSMRSTGRPRPTPGRRFHALWDKVYRRDVLWRAWVAVRVNNGAPGIDQVTLAEVEEYGIDRLLDELAAELRDGRYRPMPTRRVLIPKPGMHDQHRPLSIPVVRDRIVQAAVKIVLESGLRRFTARPPVVSIITAYATAVWPSLGI
jgi:retron-type reverse transcriptase